MHTTDARTGMPVRTSASVRHTRVDLRTDAHRLPADVDVAGSLHLRGLAVHTQDVGTDVVRG